MNVVAHNLIAYNAQRQYSLTIDSRKKSMEKLSSGYRINRAADDAAGLAISEKMRAQIRGLNKGSTNIQDGVSLVQVADGALSTVHEILHRMNELATQAANDTNTDVDRKTIQEEIGILSDEITRIGKDTTFNTMHILDDAEGLMNVGKVTQLVSCQSADNGYFSEVIPVAGGKFSPGAIMDFSNINTQNIGMLDEQEFSFNCSINCAEQFHVKFSTQGVESATNLKGKVPHYYTVDISKCTSGQEICDAIFNAVKKSPPSSGITSTTGNELKVSHSNMLRNTGDGKLYIYAEDSFDTPDLALRTAKSRSTNKNNACGVYCSDLTSLVHPEIVNSFNIQCSSNTDDNEFIRTKRINAGVLRVSDLDVTTFESANKAMDKVQAAIDYVSEFRSELGAYQNRLEHSFNNVRNIEENTQASESRIRDTNMAKEIMAHNIKNIIAQAGESMISQTNQSPRGILDLLK